MSTIVPPSTTAVSGPAGRGLSSRPTCLYRIWGRAGDEINQLLYVGITMSIDGRFSKHRHRPWWTDVSSVDLEWFDDRQSALDAERYVIHVGNPRYNISRPKMERC